MSLVAKALAASPRGMCFLVALPSLLVLGTTVGVSVWMHNRARNEAALLFARHAEAVAATIETHLDSAADSLVTLRALFENSAEVTNDEFCHAAFSLRQANPSLGALEWVSCVRGDQRAAFEARKQAEIPGFSIRGLAAEVPAVAAPAAMEYWPISNVFPPTGNEEALGFNLRAGPTVATLTQARDTGGLALSQPLDLLQGPAGEPAVILVLPAFDRHNDTFLGWAQGIVRVHRLFEQPDRSAKELGLGFRCDDLSSGSPIQVFASANTAEGASAATWSRELSAGTRQWRFTAWPTPGTLRAANAPWLVLTLGCAAAASVALYLFTLLRRARTVEELVARRTAELASTNRALAGEIDQRLRAEVELRAARDRFEGLVNSVQGLVWEFDLVGQRPVFVSNQLAYLLGHPPARWIADDGFWQQTLHPEDRAAFVASMDRRAQGENDFVESCRILAADGRQVWMRTFFRVFRDSNGRPRTLLGLSLDITAIRQAEEALARDALILASVRDAIVVTGPDGRITFWNTGAEALFGWTASEMLGCRFPQALLGSPDPKLAAVVAGVASGDSGDDWHGEWPLPRKDGSPIWAELSLQRIGGGHGCPAGIIVLAFDITARRRQQEEQLQFERKLQETQKLESLGVLAGGIAHDFNNLLTGILGNASLLRIDLPPEAPQHIELESIETAGRRAADLCRQMLAYSGRARFVLKTVDLSALVEETTRLVQASVSKSARLEYRLAHDLPPVHADATQLRQIVMNLVINASDALEGRPGRIALATALAPLDRAQLDATMFGRELAPGDFLLLEVRDTGCGMSPDTLNRVFEPFFTTKASGRGLGLAAVLGIVRSHNGTLQVDSEPGRGTTFRIYLPLTKVETAPPPEPAGVRPLRGSGRVLVIDNESLVLDTARNVLTAGGFEPECAGETAAGLAAFARRPRAFAAVVIDHAMPHPDGESPCAALRRLNSETPVVLLGGGGREEDPGGPGGNATFLHKPFEAAELLAAVHAAIASSPTARAR